MTGGYVYRADPKSSFTASIFCADYQTRHVFGLTRDEKGKPQDRGAANRPLPAASRFNLDRGEKGELYLVGYEWDDLCNGTGCGEV